MTESHSRTEFRMEVRKVEVVTVFRDRRDLPYDQALQVLAALAPVYNLFSVVAMVRDASQQGLGIKFEGQQLMASNVLQPNERYILKLTIPNTELEQPVTQPFLNSEGGGNYHYLLIKAVCRWATSGSTSKAGFELAEGNDPNLVAFVQEFLGLTIT